MQFLLQPNEMKSWFYKSASYYLEFPINHGVQLYFDHTLVISHFHFKNCILISAVLHYHVKVLNLRHHE